MSIRDIQNSKILKSKKLTREEIAVRALEIAKQMVDHGGYKNAVAGIGRMKALNQCINDSYWDEKRHIGYEREFYCLTTNNKQIIAVE